MVLIDGEVVRLGGKHLDAEGYDLLGVMTGSEGLLGVVTEVTVRILRKPTTARAVLIGFPDATRAPAIASPPIIAAGIIPGGMEMMDKPAIHAAEAFVHAGYPLDVEALLIVELDGPRGRGRSSDRRASRQIARAKRRRVAAASANSEEERLAFWAGRKAAFPAVGRISPDYYCVDGTIPRQRLPEVLARMRELSREARAARRQCLPCRRRQSAPADPVRCQQAGRARAGRGVRRRHPAALRRGRRRADRRARRRRREARPDGRDVRRESISTSSSASNAPSIPNGLLNPGKVFPAAAPLRRARPPARPSRPGCAFPDLPRF